jgi:hypothetical protein
VTIQAPQDKVVEVQTEMQEIADDPDSLQEDFAEVINEFLEAEHQAEVEAADTAAADAADAATAATAAAAAAATAAAADTNNAAAAAAATAAAAVAADAEAASSAAAAAAAAVPEPITITVEDCSPPVVVTGAPTSSPTKSPTKAPTSSPTKAPTSSPTKSPTKAPTSSPTHDEDGQKGNWHLLLRQTAPTYASDAQWACAGLDAEQQHCQIDAIDGPNFSAMNQLTSSGQQWAQHGGKFKFRLVWADSAGVETVQEWKQTSNPMTYKASGGGGGGVLGYEAVAITTVGCHWGGLEWSGGASLLDGSASHGSWWFAVGTHGAFGGGMPGPCGKTASRVELYVKKQVYSSPPTGCPAGEGAVSAEASNTELDRIYSSTWANDAAGVRHGQSKLFSPQAWSAGSNTVDEWMWVQAGGRQTITGIQIQGRSDALQYVKTFKVRDTETFQTVRDQSGSELFTSSSTGDDVSTIMFETPIVASALRVYVQTYHGHMSMRANLIVDAGCKACPAQGSDAPEGDRTYSSSWGSSVSSRLTHSKSMLNDPAARYDHSHCWAAGSNAVGEWMQIDLGSVQTANGVQIQGRGQDGLHKQYVKTYKVKVNGNWLKSKDTGTTTFNGIQGYLQGDPIATAAFESPVSTQHVKIYPQTWFGHISMRADVLVTPAMCPATCAAGYGSKTAEVNPAESGRSYSSVWSNEAVGTGHARSTINGLQAWSAELRSNEAHYDAEPWMEMDAGAEKSIVAIRVQGRRGNSDQYVQTYKVQVNGEFLEAAGGGTIFTSTSTGDAISTAMLAQPIQARFVRIYPQTYNSHMSMRAGLVAGGDLCA